MTNNTFTHCFNTDTRALECSADPMEVDSVTLAARDSITCPTCLAILNGYTGI